MLRAWNGDTLEVIEPFLIQFGLAPKKITLLKYEALTPDSFIWFLSVDGAKYCLYAEDYVPSLEHVQEIIHENLPTWTPYDKYKLKKVEKRQEWIDTSPVKSAATYIPPTKPEEFMKHATTSGFDFVFVAESKSKPKTNLD